MTGIRSLFLLVVISLVLSLARAAEAQSASDATPINWSAIARPAVNGSKTQTTLRVQLKAKINPGWHLYALDQEAGGPMRTVIQVPAGQPFTLVPESIQQPEPLINYDPNFNIDVRYFEGEAVFQLALKPVQGSKPQKTSVYLEVTFQSCNDRMCLPPTKARVPVGLTIATAGTPPKPAGQKKR